MQDMIPKGTGNSRFLKSVENFKALYPTYDAFVAALVAGNLPVDFNGVNPAGVEQVGTALSASNILKTSTAKSFGLDRTGVPDNIFALLGKYNEHWWKATAEQDKPVYRPVLERPTATIVIAANEYATIDYSATVSCNQTDGTITLDSPKSINIDLEYEYEYNEDEYDESMSEQSYAMLEEAANELLAIAPCYFTINGSKVIYYLPEGATYGEDADSATLKGSEVWSAWENVYYYYPELSISSSATNPVLIVKPKMDEVEASKPTYLNSTDRNAYPDSGVHDGICYEYMGRPYDKLPFVPKWGTLTYIGSGTYGSANPNTVSFDFQPFLVVVNGDSGAGGFIWRYGTENGYVGTGGAWYSCELTWDGNKLSWYTTQKEYGAARQHNSMGVTYTVTYFG